MKCNKELMSNLSTDHDESLYDIIVQDIKIEYNGCIEYLSRPDLPIVDIRLCIRRLMSILIYFGKNSEMMYIGRLLMAIDKHDTERRKYTPYLDQLQIYRIDDYL